MAEVSQRMDVAPAQVFAVLADGWTYSSWVVGASHIRAVEGIWPTVGARLHHSVGAWPLQISDYTEVLHSEPDRRLTLRARVWPLGEANVDMTLTPDGEGTLVVMREEPTKGPGRFWHNRVQDAILRRRNIESLARLDAIARGRSEQHQ